MTVDVKKHFPWLHNDEKDDCLLTERGTVIMFDRSHEIVCSKCLRRFAGWNYYHDAREHAKQCQIAFSNRVYRQLILLIVKVTPDSSRSEQQVCENLSSISMTKQNRAESALRSNEWATEDGQTEVYLLIEGDVPVGYLALNRTRYNEEGKPPQHCIVVIDFFIIWARRRCNYMKFLLLESLRSINERFDTVFFQDSISLDGKEFLDKIAKALGVSYKICE